MTDEEQETVVGKKVAQRLALYNHDAADTDQLVTLGTTRRGTQVAINRRAAEADKLLVTGTISFHYLAGFGGGRKSIIPGIASYETCVANHLLTIDPKEKGRHPGARTGMLQGNPMHEDMIEACGQLPPAFLLNTILSPEKKIVHLVAGDLNEAFYRGCDVVKKRCTRIISQPADLVIVSCGGYPKDINFIQAHKTVDYAMNALRPGGVMIVVAACGEGIGNADFLEWIKYARPDEMIPALGEDFQINGQTAYATLVKAQQAHILLLSELSDAVVQEMSMVPVHSMEEALSKAYGMLGTKPTTYVIPSGSVTLPLLEDG
jgi:nickel-dependent lactate racemase